MASYFDEFIPLDRTFHELVPEEGADDDVSFIRRSGRRESLHWQDLLREYRVILLSEAGSGKTTEIRNVASSLRREGKRAFFVRIEHITRSFEDSFEEGSVDEFRDWLTSGDEGWLLLDSVDEARLRDPRDFELAIRKLGRLLSGVLQRVHIVITGRTTAWRAKTDLLICRNELPYHVAEIVVDVEASADNGEEVTTKITNANKSEIATFKIVAIDDLYGDQIRAFLRGKCIEDPVAFCDAVERKDAWSLTSRPQDLAELVEFWKENKRIGSRLELMQSSIARRLEERDQNRSEVRPISIDKLRLGARLVAAATTLAQESAIRVPDGAENAKGFPIKEVLTDWDDIDCATLLSRPIFDEGIYGTVRFHHRSVREYLTAEWLHALIINEGSRARVESLFFRVQYGIEVIVPTMRPVLPWLALLDERILARVCRLAPEVIFEGGDPSQLPREKRSEILCQACEQLAQPAHGRSITDFAAVQRFANNDLAVDIKSLLVKYGDNEDVTSFLLRMIWQGEIVGLAAEAKRFALGSRAKYVRIAAFRALAMVGSETDKAEVRHAFLSVDEDIDRDWLAEIISTIPPDEQAVTWLLVALDRTPAKKQFEVDSLMEALSRLVSKWQLSLLPTFVSGLYTLLVKPPVIERRFCEISERYAWLMQVAAQSILRLIEARDQHVFDPKMLAVLSKCSIAEEYCEHEFQDINRRLGTCIVEWPELNHAVFWQNVIEARAGLDVKKGECLTDYRYVGISGRFWAFGQDSFDRICQDITARPQLDDKLVALTLAFAIYRDNDRPAAWRVKLKRLTNSQAELKSALDHLLHPPVSDLQEWRREEARWKRQAARQAAKQEADRCAWYEHLQANLESLRDPGKTGVMTNAQHYLLERILARGNGSRKWSEGNWRSLNSEFGEKVARAFRDGAVRFWRDYTPQLFSEGAQANSIPVKVIFGLLGLSIEAREEPNWPKSLSRKEAEVATRYALCELSDFPSWLPDVYVTHAETIINVVITEIDYELANQSSENKSQNVLHNASWAGRWMWDKLAPLMLTRLDKPPKSIGNLRYMLSIVQGSSLDDSTIAKLTAKKAKSSRNLTTAPIWFAMWVGVEPAVGIPELAERLAEIKGESNQTLFAMHFITALIGGRREGQHSRQVYRTVKYMKMLYLLMHQYVRQTEDIDRAGGGVYSPGLRDDAQDARDALFAFIRETPGKEAFLALKEISRLHPVESVRPWMAFHAIEKAASDADTPAWWPHQVREFHDRCERTPSNHRDLWYLAVERLNELKFDLEDGDASIASILEPIDQETEIRKFIGNWCREHSAGRYSVSQEEELADAKRPDLRFHGIGFDGPVPAELKLADKWTGPHLFERLEIQLCGDYLRDRRSSRGIFLLVYHGKKHRWDLPNGKRAESFDALVEVLQKHWEVLSPQFPSVEDIKVIGIDLTKRGIDAKAASINRNN